MGMLHEFRTELPRSHVERLQAKSPEVLFSVLIKDLRTDLCRRISLGLIRYFTDDKNRNRRSSSVSKL